MLLGREMSSLNALGARDGEPDHSGRTRALLKEKKGGHEEARDDLQKVHQNAPPPMIMRSQKSCVGHEEEREDLQKVLSRCLSCSSSLEFFKLFLLAEVS